MPRGNNDAPYWHFQCPECGVGDGEFGRLATADEIYCEVCLSEEGRTVRVRRWSAEQAEYSPRCSRTRVSQLKIG